jgi:hypothetical protein
VSDDLAVLLRPAAAYRELAARTGAAAWKRPLWFALLGGCAASVTTTGALTARLVVPCAIYASLVPLVEIAVLAGLLRRGRAVPLARAVDLFFMGHCAWSLWLIMVSAIFAFTTPMEAFEVTGTLWRWSTIGGALAWSAYTDYCFFRCVSPERVWRNLLAQRAVCWTAGLVIFGGGSLWAGIVGVLHL